MEWSPAGDTCCPSVVLEASDIYCPGPLSFSRFLDNVSDICRFSDQDNTCIMQQLECASTSIVCLVYLYMAMKLSHLILSYLR